MTDTTTASLITNQELDDATLAAAIKACRPYKYLEDLKGQVAEHLGNPALNTAYSGAGSFGYRVYCLNKQVEEQEMEDRIAAMGFARATLELLVALEGCKVEMLCGIGSLFGETIRPGSIKADGRGGYLFLPKGNRTKGLWPTYIRKLAADSHPVATQESMILVSGEGA